MNTTGVLTKGCIRIPVRFHEFLDRRGVFDADCEAANGRSCWVLKHDRQAARGARRYFVAI